MINKLKEFFKILFLFFGLPFALSKGRKRKAKNKIKNYFFNLF